MEKHLHFKDEKSDKFWSIVVNGNEHTVSYGRTGTKGTSKTKTFDDNSLAELDAEKLIKSKMKKGYVEKGYGEKGELQSKTVIDYEHGKPFDVHKMAPRIKANPHDEDTKSWDEKLEEYLLVQDSAATTHFVAGIAGEAFDDPNTNIVLESLVKHKKSLPNLVSLFLNDIDSEECELSWIVEGDLTPIWKNFPHLRELTVRGYPGEMDKMSMPELEKFTIECSGMNKKNLEQIFAADLPNLTHLELWVGTDDYGGTTKVSDWEPLLSGNLFPKLRYLGLRNCDYADGLAQAVANAPILDRIETLDMSLGTMGDEGAAALYQSDKVRGLKHLDLHYHYMSDWMVGRYQGVDKAVPKPPKPKAAYVAPARTPASAPAPAPAPAPQPTKSGGLLSKLFGKAEPVLPPPPPPPPPLTPVPVEVETPKPLIDYASIPLIPAGEFGPTVNVSQQEDAYEYDEEGWRYVAFGE